MLFNEVIGQVVFKILRFKRVLDKKISRINPLLKEKFKN